MKHSLLLALGVFSWLQATDLPEPAALHVPYQLSMNPASTTWRRWSNKDKRWQWWFKGLYERNNLSKVTASNRARIPKIIHQIWIGGQVPEKYKGWQESWQKMHPDWEYRLWTDEDIADFPFTNRAQFDAIEQLGGKVDVWRYEILYLYGGLYADMDMECLQPFDVLHHSYDCVLGLENGGYFHLGNAIFAATQGHPVMRNCIELIGELEVRPHSHEEIIKCTGPICLTEAAIKYLQRTHDTRIIALPHSYLFPWPNNCGKNRYDKEYIRPESFALHHWTDEWGVTAADRKKEQRKKLRRSAK